MSKQNFRKSSILGCNTQNSFVHFLRAMSIKTKRFLINIILFTLLLSALISALQAFQSPNSKLGFWAFFFLVSLGIIASLWPFLIEAIVFNRITYTRLVLIPFVVSAILSVPYLYLIKSYFHMSTAIFKSFARIWIAYIISLPIIAFTLLYIQKISSRQTESSG